MGWILDLGKMKWPKTEVNLWLGFVLSLMASVLVGFDLGFNVYALRVKKTFNFTQTQVEIIASMCTVGMTLGFLQGILLQWLGYTLTLSVLWIFSSLPSGLYSFAVYDKNQVKDLPSIVYITQLALSAFLCMMFICVSSIYMKQLPRKHSGKIVGAYTAFICMGKIFFCALLEIFFEHNLAGFFLTFFILSLVIIGLCVLSVIPIARQQDRKQKLLNGERDEMGIGSETKASDTSSETVDILKSLYFHCVFWPSAILFSCSYTCLNNITAFGESASLTRPLFTVYVISVVIVVTRLLCGNLFDYFSSKMFGIFLMILADVSLWVGMLLGMFWFSEKMVFVTTILIGVTQGISLPIPLSILSLCFGEQHYAFFTNAFFMIGGAFQIIFQIISGMFYDAQVERGGIRGHTCHGHQCFFWTFSFFMCIAFLICLFHLATAIKKCH